MSKYRSYVLPLAIVLGLALHRWCAFLSPVVPFFIFVILLLNFTAVDIRSLKLTPLCVWIMLFQMAVSMAGYYGTMALSHNTLLAQGVMMGILCPVASSVVVVSCMLGADRATVTEYTIFGNLMAAIFTPLCFSWIGVHQDMGIWMSFLLILKKIGITIALPFFVALLLQLVWKRANDAIARFKDVSFYLWAFLLLIVIGQTIDFIFIHGKGNVTNILWLGVISLATCVLNFGVGRWMGRRYGDVVAGGQLLGQKNTAMGIWMANTFLNPLTSVTLAFYAIWQNLFNSWQIWRLDRTEKHPEEV